MPEIDHSRRDHALLSASSAELWINCPGSAMACQQYPDEAGPYALEGTIAHEVAQIYAETYLNQTGHAELNASLDVLRRRHGPEAVTSEMLECAEGYAAYIMELKTPTSIVLLERRLDFSPWVPGGFGTGDCVILDNGRVTVIDYKYGRGVAVDSEDNPQMQLYALGAINDYSCIYEFDKVVMSIYQPRINNVSEAERDVSELLFWAENTVVPAAKEAADANAHYRAGPHCRKFCRHAGRCPTLRNFCCDFVEHHGLHASIPRLSDEEIVEVTRMEPLIKMWLDRVNRSALDTILTGGRIEGLRVVEGRGLRRWTDEAQAEKRLRAAGACDDDLFDPPVLKTVAAMEKSVKHLGKNFLLECVGDLIQKTPGKPTLVPASDKRPDYDPGADFQKLD